jgi:hypothetical protein
MAPVRADLRLRKMPTESACCPELDHLAVLIYLPEYRGLVVDYGLAPTQQAAGQAGNVACEGRL